MDQKVIDSAITYIECLFANDHGGHDADHSLRVYRNALLRSEDPCSLFKTVYEEVEG